MLAEQFHKHRTSGRLSVRLCRCPSGVLGSAMVRWLLLVAIVVCVKDVCSTDRARVLQSSSCLKCWTVGCFQNVISDFSTEIIADIFHILFA